LMYVARNLHTDFPGSQILTTKNSANETSKFSTSNKKPPIISTTDSDENTTVLMRSLAKLHQDFAPSNFTTSTYNQPVSKKTKIPPTNKNKNAFNKKQKIKYTTKITIDTFQTESDDENPFIPETKNRVSNRP
jgi:hypothetical protein